MMLALQLSKLCITLYENYVCWLSPGQPLYRRDDGENTVRLMRIKWASGFESDCIMLDLLNLLFLLIRCHTGHVSIFMQYSPN